MNGPDIRWHLDLMARLTCLVFAVLALLALVLFLLPAGASGDGNRTNGGLAQPGEHLPCKQEARGSSPRPSSRTIHRREQ